MTALLIDTCAVAGFLAAVGAGYLIVTRAGMLILAAELDDGCTVCYLLGRIPFGGPYWLLRQHLRKIAMQPDESIRQTAP